MLILDSSRLKAKMIDPLLKRGFELFCKLVLRNYCKLTTNAPLLPDGPFIVCANHSSHLDTPALMIGINRPFQDFYMLAAKDHFQPNSHKKGIFQHLLNLILVDRRAPLTDLKRLVQDCKQAVNQQKILVIYPEGTRCEDGHLHPFKSGTVYLAYKLNLPIIPAGISGSGQALAKNCWLPRPYPIQINFGKPILPTVIDGLTQKQMLQNLTKELESSVKALLNND